MALKITKTNKNFPTTSRKHLTVTELSSTSPNQEETNETRNSVQSLHKIGWDKEEIAKSLQLELYEVELILQEQDEDD